jgi:hypothetical protein
VITPTQCRAARGLLDWSQQELAEKVAVVQRALEAAGVEFIDENGGGPGVRLQKTRHIR